MWPINDRLWRLAGGGNFKSAFYWLDKSLFNTKRFCSWMSISSILLRMGRKCTQTCRKNYASGVLFSARKYKKNMPLNSSMYMTHRITLRRVERQKKSAEVCGYQEWCRSKNEGFVCSKKSLGSRTQNKIYHDSDKTKYSAVKIYWFSYLLFFFCIFVTF